MPARSLDPSWAPPRLVGSVRPGGGVRWLAELNAADARAYARAVAPMVGGIEASLRPAVLANRARSGVTPAPALEDWRSARRSWRCGIRMAARAPAVLVADVAACYASITPAAVERALRDLGAHPDDARRTRRWLDRSNEAGVPGLPVGPAPSAILANAVLASVDEALVAAGTSHLRWVDDVVAVAGSARSIQRAHDALRASLERIELTAHDRKTAMLCDRDAIRTRLEGGTSSVGGSDPGLQRRGAGAVR